MYHSLDFEVRDSRGTARHDAVAWGYARVADRQGVDIIQQFEVTGHLADMAGLRLPIETHILQAYVTEPLKPLVDARFDGRGLQAHPGDTLASGENIVARGFKYHRARGVYSAGVEEPNAYVHLRQGLRHEPNARATTSEVFDGMHATSQNAWPDVRLDFGAVTGYLPPFLSAGFYYKTFIGPFSGTKFWMICENFIRKAAGMGRGTKLSDPDSYEKVNAFCDLLVVGAGASGLAAALTAGQAGADVIVVEQDFALGGSLLSQPVGGAGDDWLVQVKSQLNDLPNVRILTRTTAFGAYEQDVYGLVERVSDHLQVPQVYQPRQRYWLVHTKQVVLATGAIERPLVFANNDLPGVMLAGSIQSYTNRLGVLAGQRIMLCSNNNSAYQAAVQLAHASADVTLVDTRPDRPQDVAAVLAKAGVTVMTGKAVIAAKGRRGVTGALIVPVDKTGKATGAARHLACDVIGLSGGWSPVVHLWSHRFGKPRSDEASAAFVPGDIGGETVRCAGRMVAAQTLGERIETGIGAAKATLKALELKPSGKSLSASPEIQLDTGWSRGMLAIWAITDATGKTKGKAFVDIQHDVKLSDLDQAYREGYVSVEHLKRYTTTGMAPDQGKTSNIIALARVAELSGKTIPDTGTTTFRPPFTPVTIGALVGHEHGSHFAATRYSPIHDWHLENGAVMSEAGGWMRPWYYPQGSETLREAYIREAAHVRRHVGIVDVSTLGKIAVQGPDAAEFLNRVYVNGWKTLQVGRLRYGVMLREDGFVMDDGATARLGEFDYFMSTTTANAAKVLALSEHLLQTAWRDLKVHVTSVTDQWAAFAVAGPKARDLLQSVLARADISREAMPNNHFVTGQIADTNVRLHRMSYSGELAYEVYVPSGFARHVWEGLIEAGKAFDLRPYGTEAMGALRIEKGHVAGPEIEGRTTLKDLGLAGFASSKKPFVGAVLKERPVLVDPARATLVGLSMKGETGAVAGSLIYGVGHPKQGHGEGWVSSTTYSPALGHSIALALIQNGKARLGEDVQVVNHLEKQTVMAQIVSPHFFDPQGNVRMPDIRSPLAECLQPGRYGAEFATGPGLTLSESPVSLVQIAGWDDFEEAVLGGLQTLGFAGVGGYRNWLHADDRQLYRISPDRVLIASLSLLALPDSLLNTSSLAVQDLSHARTRITVEGPAAEDVMARLAPIDFRASAMLVDGFVQTGVHHVGVLIHRTSAERFDILVPVTWARSIWDFICLNATPFGYDVRRAA